MKNIFTLILLFSFYFSLGQTTFNHRVYIKSKGTPSDSLRKQDSKQLSNYVMFEIAEMDNEKTLKIDSNSILYVTEEYNAGGVDYKVNKEIEIIFDTTLVFSEKMKHAKRFYLPKGKHKANLSISKDSLLINFWLSENYYKKEPEEQAKSPYNPNVKYFIKLKNREYVSFLYSNFELSALTIPFKYHFGFKEKDMIIDPVFNVDLNINTFFGKRIGKVSYVNDAYKGIIQNNWSVTMGAFAGLSSQKIDSISTSLNINPVNGDYNVPCFTYGVGAVFNIRDFNLGLFLGADKGLGNTAEKWNFDNRIWFGFGLGYKLAFLSKQE